MKKYTRIFKEDEDEDKSHKAIKDLIDLDWEKDTESTHRALAMIEGLFHADTKAGKAFIKDLSDFTSGLKIEDYE